MSYRLIPLAWQSPLPAIDKLIMLKLCDCANDDGSSCRPSLATIMEDCGVSRRKAQMTLRGFEQAGLIELVSAASGRRTNEYRIVVQRLEAAGAEGRIPCAPDVDGGLRATAKGRTTCAAQVMRGESDDQKGRTRFALPLKDPSEEKKIARERADDFLGDGALKTKWDSTFPSLAGDADAFKAELERAMTWHRGKGIPIGDLKAMFSSWLDNPKTHAHVLKAPKHLKQTKRKTPPEAIRPQRGPGLSPEDYELVKSAVEELEAQRPGMWQSWLKGFTMVSLDGNVLTMEHASAWTAKRFKSDYGSGFESCLAKVSRRRIELEVTSFDGHDVATA